MTYERNTCHSKILGFVLIVSAVLASVGRTPGVETPQPPVAADDSLAVVSGASDPLVVAGPVDATVPKGGIATFSVAASGGEGPVTYQWQGSPDDGVTFPPPEDPRYTGVDTKVFFAISSEE